MGKVSSLRLRPKRKAVKKDAAPKQKVHPGPVPRIDIEKIEQAFDAFIGECEHEKLEIFNFGEYKLVKREMQIRVNSLMSGHNMKLIRIFGALGTGLRFLKTQMEAALEKKAATRKLNRTSFPNKQWAKAVATHLRVALTHARCLLDRQAIAEEQVVGAEPKKQLNKFIAEVKNLLKSKKALRRKSSDASSAAGKDEEEEEEKPKVQNKRARQKPKVENNQEGLLLSS